MIRLHLLGTLDLTGPAGCDPQPVLRGAKRLGMLAYLALARPRGFHRRDILLALFWPELDTERGRANLRSTIYLLRQCLGAEAIPGRGAEEVGVDGGQLWCDAVAFEQALDDGRTDEALALYRGDLLPGFHIPGVPEWERWLEGERVRLRTRAVAAAAALADSAAERGDHPAAIHWSRRLVAIAPHDEAAVRRLMTRLDAAGERSAAMDAFHQLERGLDTELGIAPGAETRALAEQIRDRPAPAPPRPAPRPVTPAPAPAEEAAPAAPRPRGRRAGILIGALVLVGVAASVVGSWSAPRPQTVAVGEIRMEGDSAAILAELLSTSIARVPGLQVLSAERMVELAGEGGARGAARRGGAGEVMEGRVSRRPGGAVRLDLRRYNLASGAVRGAFTVEGADLLEAMDLAAERLAADLGYHPPAGRFAVAGSGSLVAHGIYSQGLRAFYAGDRRAAERLFLAALEEDTSFAMAALYAGRVANTPLQWDLLARAARLSAASPERERLLIRAEWASSMQEPAALAYAESLAVRYPAEPDGHRLLGRMLTSWGDFPRAIRSLERAFALDSGSVPGAQRCAGCEAADALATAYGLAGRVAEGERMARWWTRRQPLSYPAWWKLGSVLEGQERYAEAVAALQRADSLQPGQVELSGIWLRTGQFDRVEALWNEHMERGGHDAQTDAYWSQTINFRLQGRQREALATAREFRRRAARPPAPASAWIYEAAPVAQVLFEMGRYAEAAALWDSIAGAAFTTHPGRRNQRHRVGYLTLEAEAHAAMGDTARVAMLEDSVRRLGSGLLYARDRRLHHHLRGLRLAAAGRPDQAAAAFRRALYSPVDGHMRTNQALARALLDGGHADEAIPLLRTTLRGPIGAGGTSANRTEAQLLLGRAYQAAGRADSAAVQYRAVLHAWRRADPAFAPRRDSVRARLAEVGD